MSSARHGPYADHGPSYAAHFQRLHTMERCTRTIDRCTRTMDRRMRTMLRRTRRIFSVSIRRDVVRGQWTAVCGQWSVVRGAFSASPYDGTLYADDGPSYAAHFCRLHTTGRRTRTMDRCTRTMLRRTRRIFIVPIQRDVVRGQWTVACGRCSVVRGAFSSSPYDGTLYADNGPLYAAHFHRLQTTRDVVRGRQSVVSRVGIGSSPPREAFPGRALRPRCRTAPPSPRRLSRLGELRLGDREVYDSAAARSLVAPPIVSRRHLAGPPDPRRRTLRACAA